MEHKWSRVLSLSFNYTNSLGTVVQSNLQVTRRHSKSKKQASTLMYLRAEIEFADFGQGHSAGPGRIGAACLDLDRAGTALVSCALRHLQADAV